MGKQSVTNWHDITQRYFMWLLCRWCCIWVSVFYRWKRFLTVWLPTWFFVYVCMNGDNLNRSLKTQDHLLENWCYCLFRSPNSSLKLLSIANVTVYHRCRCSHQILNEQFCGSLFNKKDKLVRAAYLKLFRTHVVFPTWIQLTLFLVLNE